MKKFLALLTSILAVVACFLLASCGDKEPVKVDENSVIITANASSFSYDGKSLKDYMDYLQDEGKLTYTVESGMVTTINGKPNTLNSYWMLYTSDTENSNSEWGTLEYEDTIYCSATSGVEILAVKENCIYIWAYQTF